MPSCNPERRACEARRLSALPFSESSDRRRDTVARLDLCKVRLLGSGHPSKQPTVHAAEGFAVAGCGMAASALRIGFPGRSNRLRFRRRFSAAQCLNTRLELLNFPWQLAEVSRNFALCDLAIGDQT